MKFFRLFLLIPVLALAACVPIPPDAVPPVQPTASPSAGAAVQDPLVDTHWQLSSFGPEAAPTPVLPDATITLNFGADGQAGGNGGCNSYGGAYHLQDGTLTFGQLTSTLRACLDDKITQQETRYLQALGTSGQYSVAGDRLIIWYDNRQGQLNFVAAPSATPTVPAATPSPVTPTPTGSASAPAESTTLPVPPLTLTPAEPPERVSFAAGATSGDTEVTSLLPSGPGMKQYVLAAGAGQTLTVVVTSDGVPLSLIVEGPGAARVSSEASPANGGYRASLTVTPTETGDYRVTLAKADHTPSTNYRVDFSLLATAAVPTAALASTAVATSPAEGATPTTFTDPFAYCAAVGTLDAPDARYAGPKMPAAIVNGLQKALNLTGTPAPPITQNSFWRCMEGKVYACTVGANLPCLDKANLSKTPSPGMLEYCRANPTADFIPAYVTGHNAVYEWQCKAGVPEAGKQVAQVDAQGFIAGIWYQINP